MTRAILAWRGGDRVNLIYGRWPWASSFLLAIVVFVAAAIGSDGNPRRADADLGADMLRLKVDTLVRAVEALRADLR